MISQSRWVAPCGRTVQTGKKLFLNGQLRYQWLEAGGGDGKFKKISCGNHLAQGANKVWRLFSIDRRYLVRRRGGLLGLSMVRRHLAFISFNSLRVAFLFCLPQQGIPSHLACAPLPLKAVSSLQAKQNIAYLLLFLSKVRQRREASVAYEPEAEPDPAAWHD